MKSLILIVVASAFVVWLAALAFLPDLFSDNAGGTVLSPAMISAAFFIILPLAIALFRMFRFDNGDD